MTYGRGGVRRALVFACVAAIVSLPTTASRADGDPASDTLLEQSVFFPYDVPSQPAQVGLQRVVDRVYARGNRIKVAVIHDQTDLGSVPSLFGHPADYAHLLGAELELWYVGPVLVVMPAGFGIFDGGRSTQAEEAVLRSVPVDASSPDRLTQGATTAVQRLAAASVLDSADVRAPLVTAYPASARRGRPAALRFDVFDDSGRSSAVVRIYEGGALVATLAVPMQFQISTRHADVAWHVPIRLRSRRLRFCVVASDPSGNRSAPSCAPFLRVT
jgi:hypothetical protein